MRAYKNQKGAGLLEVLVALMLLAVGVLGFVGLQLRAVEATTEGVYRIQAMNLARDLSERIRVNRDNYLEVTPAGNNPLSYQKQITVAANQKDSSKNCYTQLCTAAETADFDVAQIKAKADSFGMTFNLIPCEGAAMTRQCVYVAWNDTSATKGADTTACTNGNGYRTDSQCIVLEVY